ncbi:hypothetical protein ACTXT7_013490 [Hymenolepis weldensis]
MTSKENIKLFYFLKNLIYDIFNKCYYQYPRVLRERNKLESLQCPECNKFFGLKRNLKRHIDNIHKNLKPFKCEICERCYSDRGYLENHVRFVHAKLRPFQCPECGKSFAYKEKLIDHVSSIHNELKPFHCPECNKSFSLKGNLNRHVDRIHKNSVSLQILKILFFIIDDPPALKLAWISSNGLKMNLLIAIREPRLAAPETILASSAKRAFYSRRNWMHILKAFTNLRPFECDFCEKSFSREATFNKHVQCVHEGLRPYKCEICEKVFGRRNNLLVHISGVHNGERPYSCSYCHKNFKVKIHLSRHIEALHKDRVEKASEFTAITLINHFAVSPAHEDSWVCSSCHIMVDGEGKTLYTLSRRRCLGMIISICLGIYVQTRKYIAGLPMDAVMEILSPVNHS